MHYMSTDFVDSSSQFLLQWGHTHIDTVTDSTDHPNHASPAVDVGNYSRTIYSGLSKRLPNPQ